MFIEYKDEKPYKIDRNGTKYYQCVCRCPKCDGTGGIPQFWRIEGGRCFMCGGSGKIHDTIKEYTPEYAAKLEARRKARAEERARKEAEKRAEEERIEAERKAERIAAWREANPEKAKAADLLHAMAQTSDFVGEEGKRIDLKAIYLKGTSFSARKTNYYDSGIRYVHIFSVDSKKVTWITSTIDLDAFTIGKTYNVRGTVKKHEEYNDIKQTMLTRCKVSEVEEVAAAA